MDRVVLVTGGRTFSDYRFVSETLEYHHPDLIVHGAARGADSLADRWALENGIPRVVFAVHDNQWRVWGKAAGHMRNDDMLAFLRAIAWHDEWGRPDWSGAPSIEAIAFPGGSGTNHMCARLELAGVPLWDHRDFKRV